MRDRLKKPYQIVTSVYVALIFTIFLLFFDKNGLAAISAAKMRCYYALTLCYIGAVVVLLLLHFILQKLTWAQFCSDLKRTPLAAWLILLYLLFTLVSALFSEYDTVWLGGGRSEGVLTISLYCVSFYLTSRFYRPERWQIYVAATAVTVFCVICVFQKNNVNILDLYPLRDGMTCAQFNKSFIGTIGNIDFAAAFLCIAVPIFWCAILRLKDKLRFLLFLPLLLCLYVLAQINVAAGYVGIIIGTLLSLPVVLPCAKKWRIVVFAAVAALLVAAVIVIYFCKFPQKELSQLHNVLHGKIKDSYASGRVYIWRTTLRAVPDHLWFGTGPDTLSKADFAKREICGADGAVQMIRLYDAAHSEYLTILYHQGIFALLAYLGALGVTLTRWVRQASKNAVAAIAGTAVLCYSLQAFFGISQLITSPFFWCVFGIAVSALSVKNTANARRKN